MGASTRYNEYLRQIEGLSGGGTSAYQKYLADIESLTTPESGTTVPLYRGPSLPKPVAFGETVAPEGSLKLPKSRQQQFAEAHGFGQPSGDFADADKDAAEQIPAALADWTLRGGQGLSNIAGAIGRRLSTSVDPKLREMAREQGPAAALSVRPDNIAERAGDALDQQRKEVAKYAPIDTKAGLVANIGTQFVATGAEYMGTGGAVRGGVSGLGHAGFKVAQKEAAEAALKKGLAARFRYGASEVAKDAAAVSGVDILESAVGPENTTAGAVAAVTDPKDGKPSRFPRVNALSHRIAASYPARTAAEIGVGVAGDAAIRGIGGTAGLVRRGIGNGVDAIAERVVGPHLDSAVDGAFREAGHAGVERTYAPPPPRARTVPRETVVPQTPKVEPEPLTHGRTQAEWDALDVDDIIGPETPRAVEPEPPPTPAAPLTKAEQKAADKAAKAIEADRIKYGRSVLQATGENAEAMESEGSRIRLRMDRDSDILGGVGANSTGKGAFARGRRTQATNRGEAAVERLRASGQEIPDPDVAALMAIEDDPFLLPMKLNEEFAGLKDIADDDLVRMADEVEEQAYRKPDDYLANTRRVILSGEAKRRGLKAMQPGEIDIALLSLLGRVAAGGTVGAALDDENPLEGAIAGAALAGGAPALVKAGLEGAAQPGFAQWYSRLERAIEGAPQDKALGSQWLGMIEKAPKGIWKAEKEWTGIDAFLRENADRVLSRDEVLAAAKERGIPIGEVVSRHGDASPAKYSHYSEKGGSDYREIKLTLDGDDVDYRSPHFPEKNVIVHARVSDRTLPNGERVLYVDELQSDWSQRLRKGTEGTPATPFEKTDDWMGLAMKRLIDEAVEGGYDRIAWSPGATQFKRYGSERIEWKRLPDGSFDVAAKRQVGGEHGGQDIGMLAEERGLNPDIRETVRSEKQLAGVLARVLDDGDAELMASKIWPRMQEAAEGTSMPRKEGMEGFYDDIMPKWVKQYAKKLGVDLEIEPLGGARSVEERTRSIGSGLLRDGAGDTSAELEALAKERAAHEAGGTLALQGNPSFRVKPFHGAVTGADKFYAENPHVWHAGWTGATRAQAFDKLPADAMVWVFHGTDDKTADAMLRAGVRESDKPRSLGRERFEAGEDARFQPGSGLGGGLYIGTDPFNVNGYGRRLLGVRVPKRSIRISPEQATLGTKSLGDALSLSDAMVMGDIPASAFVDVTAAGPNAKALDALRKAGKVGGQPLGIGEPGTVARMGLGLAGAATGAAVDDEHPLRGAAIGAALGVGAPSAAAIDFKEFAKGAKASLGKNFRSRGDLPETVFKRKIEKDASVAREMTRQGYLLKDFDRAVRAHYGKTLDDATVKLLDDALKRDAPMTAVPEPIREPLAAMRAHMDGLSRAMIAAGVVQGDLALKVDSNMGTYATRSYRTFDDPEWAKKVPQEIKNRVVNLLRSEYPDANDEEIAGLLDTLLFRGEEDSPIALIKAGKLGSKDLSILTKRKEIAPEIRALWGEYENPRVNYARSVAKMAGLVANHKFLGEVRSTGLGTFLHEKPIVRDGVSYRTPIAAEGSKTMEPLNGLYTTPEIAQAFKETLAPQRIGDNMRRYMKINGMVKASKTVLSVASEVRNLVSNIGFATANGHWRASKAGTAAATVATNLAKLPNKERRAYYLKLQSLGVVGESTRAGELQDVLKDATKGNLDEFADNVIKRNIAKGARVATDVYQAGDDVWKIFAFENELARYRKALPDLSDAELEKRAANIVRMTYPTYSMVPEAIKKIRRAPFIGAFVSFPAEVVRTGYHTIKLALDELADPALRSIGAERMAGIVAAVTAAGAAATASRFLTGTSKDDDEDMRRFMAPWSRNSTIVHLGSDEEGNRRYVDLSFTDPYAYLRKPVIAALTGDDWEEALMGAFKEAAEPFFGEEILAGKLLDIARNTKKEGGRVFNPESPFMDRTSDKIAHIWDALEPGTLTSLNRVAKGVTGTETDTGRTYDASDELLNMATGVRRQSLDLPQAFSFKVRDATEKLDDSRRILTSVAARRGSVTESELREAYDAMEAARREHYEDLYRTASAARRLGVPDTQVRKILAAGGMNKKDIAGVMNGTYNPYMPSESFLESVETSIAAMGGDRSEFNNRRNLIRQYAAEARQKDRLLGQGSANAEGR